jgi:hypothetical protein
VNRHSDHNGHNSRQFIPWYQEEEADMTEGGPFYRFLLNDVELVDMPRAAFDQKHGISKYAQGYSFLRDNAENPTGVVFWWCRSNLEQHVKCMNDRPGRSQESLSTHAATETE